MAVPLIVWGGVGVATLFGLGYAADEVGDAATASTKLIKAATIAGGLYVSYRALQSAGVFK